MSLEISKEYKKKTETHIKSATLILITTFKCPLA